MADKATIQTELDLLTALERGEVVTQIALSKKLSVSVGLINALMKRVIQNGLVKAQAVPYKRWAYYLTPTGASEKTRLVACYLENSLDFFRSARAEYVALFREIQQAGRDRVVLVGCGELVEIALLAARDAGVQVVGLFDSEANAESLYGLPVLGSLENVDHAAALTITASRYPQQAYESVFRKDGPPVLAPGFMRLSDPTAGEPVFSPVAESRS